MAKRDWLGRFGRDLSEADLGAALAEWVTPTPTIGGFAGPPDPIDERARLDSGAQSGPPTGNAVWLRDRWLERLRKHRRNETPTRHGIALGFAVHPLHSRSELLDLMALLSAGTGVAAVHVISAPTHAVEWLWPLDVAFLRDRASLALREQIKSAHWREFVSFTFADRATRPIELLVLPHTLVEATSTLLGGAGFPRIQTVLVLGGHGGSA